MSKLAGLGIIGAAVFFAAIWVELTKKTHQQTSIKPGDTGILH
jgi:hypothetical protein